MKFIFQPVKLEECKTSVHLWRAAKKWDMDPKFREGHDSG